MSYVNYVIKLLDKYHNTVKPVLTTTSDPPAYNDQPDPHVSNLMANFDEVPLSNNHFS